MSNGLYKCEKSHNLSCKREPKVEFEIGSSMELITKSLCTEQ